VPRRDSEISGVVAAVPTIVDPNHQPKITEFINHCKWALDNGCDGLNILGTTGEANSQGPATRKSIMKAAARDIDPSKMMVGTGTSDLEMTVELTRYADKLGYAVALVLPPFYYTPVTDDGILSYFKAIDNALGTSDIVLYLYNFPALSGIQSSVQLIKRMVEEMPNRIRGLKDSSGDVHYCKEIVEAVPNFKVFPSNEICISEARINGFAGCISGSVNVTGPWAGKLWHDYDGRNLDSQLVELKELRTAISSVPLVQAVKHLIGLREHNIDWNIVIPPLMPLTESQKIQLTEVAQKLSYI